MRVLFAKRTLAVAVICLALGVGVFALVSFLNKEPQAPAEPIRLESAKTEPRIIGASVQGRDIEAYTYGNGDTHLVFVGGIHGGYEWNSVLLAYTFIDYLEANLKVIPDNLRVTVIPSANPDGLYAVIRKEGRFTVADVPENGSTGLGRFNAHDVDLNRNFDCKWQPESTWREKVVSAGSSPFSEPETQAIRDFVLEHDPDAVVLWHSQANAVYPAECGGDILPATRDIMEAYARAAGYQALESFDAYEVTGAADGWLATVGIPALTVELKTHEAIEWEQNLAGVEALFEYYGQKTGSSY